MEDLSFSVPSNKGHVGLFRSIFTRKKTDYETSEAEEMESFFEAVRGAKRDLESVQRLFDNTSDPDLIEYAIYEEYAVKLRLSYLVKKAKEKNIRSVNFTAL